MKFEDFLTKSTEYKKIDEWVSTHLKAYFSKIKANLIDKEEDILEHHDIEHIIDFLKINKNDDISRLNRLGVMEAHRQAQQWTKRLGKKVKLIDETEKDIQQVYEYDNGYSWVKLISSSAYEREGKLMQHCVSGYYNSKKDTTIFSLRDDENMPHCTIEYNKSYNGQERINQIKGKQNKAVVSKYHKFVCDFLDKSNVSQISSYDLESNGLIKASGKIYFISSLPDGIILEQPLHVVNPESIPKIIGGTKEATFSVSFVKDGESGGGRNRYRQNENDVVVSPVVWDATQWSFKTMELSGFNGKFSDLDIQSMSLTKSEISAPSVTAVGDINLKSSVIKDYTKLKAQTLNVSDCDEFIIDSRLDLIKLSLTNVKKVIVRGSVYIRELTLMKVENIVIEGHLSTWHFNMSECNVKEGFFSNITIIKDGNSSGAVYLNKVTGCYAVKFRNEDNVSLSVLKIENSSITTLHDINSVALISNNKTITDQKNCNFQGQY